MPTDLKLNMRVTCKGGRRKSGASWLYGTMTRRGKEKRGTKSSSSLHILAGGGIADKGKEGGHPSGTGEREATAC